MSRFFIERPILANVIAIITMLLGAVCLYNLPVAQYPQIVPPTIQVSTSYAGASAETVANTIGIPIEHSVNGVENSIYMQSTSGSDGTYTLTVTFVIGTDLNVAVALVQNAVNSALPQLPQQVRAQGINVRKVSTNILLIESLYSDDNRFDETFLSNYAIINLQSPIARLPGVGQVTIFGAGPYSMRVWLDPDKLKSYGLTVLDVQKAIQNQNIQVAAGQIGGPPAPSNQLFQFTVTTLGRLSDAEEFENIIVKAQPPSTETHQTLRTTETDQTAAIVRLRDIAKVELSQQQYTIFSGLSGKTTAHVAVFALPGANALEVAAETRSLMTQMSKAFPPGLKYTTLYDTTLFINQSIHTVYETLIEAGILVLIVIMLFLQNFRAILVPATTVPVTIIGAFAAMALLGFTVNLMTLFALILAIGIVVDDAIVIVENTSRYIEQGLTPKEAAIKAMSELTGPVLGITLVLTAVFLPASFLPGITGQMFRQFALVIAATAIISAINALTLKPTQCALYLRPLAKDRKINWFYRGFNRIYGAIERRYIAIVKLDGAAPPLDGLPIFHHRRTGRRRLRNLSNHANAPGGPGILYCHGAASRRRFAAASAPGLGRHRHRSQEYSRHQRMGHDRGLLGARFGKAFHRCYNVRHISRLGPTTTGVFPDGSSARAPEKISIHSQRPGGGTASLANTRSWKRFRVPDGH